MPFPVAIGGGGTLSGMMNFVKEQAHSHITSQMAGLGTGATGASSSVARPVHGPAGGATEAAVVPALPFVGQLEKKSATLGVWQMRRVEIDKMSFSYYKEGYKSARETIGQNDLISVVGEPPSSIHIRARLAGGEERDFEFRAPAEAEMRMWLRLIQVAFELEDGQIELRGPEEGLQKKSSTRDMLWGHATQVVTMVTSKTEFAAQHAAQAARAHGAGAALDWLHQQMGAAHQMSNQWFEQLNQQMEDSLTSCDEGKTEMLLDVAISAGLESSLMPSAVTKAAKRIAGRNLREATASGDPQRLKGALLAAKRLGAVNVPEFAPAVERYRAVRKLPEGWNVAQMVADRQAGKAKLLHKSDVSCNLALRALVQLMIDRTFHRIRTRDRKGEPLPVQLEVVQVAEVQNETQWVDFLVRREAVREQIVTTIEPVEGAADLSKEPVETSGPLEEAKLLVSLSEQTVVLPPKSGSGALLSVASPVSGQPLCFPAEAAANLGAEGGEMELQKLLAPGLPGPPLDEEISEAWLFHGTKPIAAHKITSEDFRIDLAGSSAGTLYGRGIYLAESSFKADEYSQKDPKTGLYTMLLCRVVLGRALCNAEVKPDPRKCEELCIRGQFHSVLGDRKACRGTFREFVVFDEDSVYPSYIVSYRRVPPPPGTD